MESYSSWDFVDGRWRKGCVNAWHLGSNPWLHSFVASLTPRAGGFSLVFLLFAWGWKEGNAHHIEREHQLARRISTAVTLLRAGRLKRLQKVV